MGEDDEDVWQDVLDGEKEDANDHEKDREHPCQMEGGRETLKWEEVDENEEEAKDEVLKEAGDEQREEDKQIGVKRDRLREEKSKGDKSILANRDKDAGYSQAASQSEPGPEEWQVIESIS